MDSNSEVTYRTQKNEVTTFKTNKNATLNFLHDRMPFKRA